MQIALKTQMPKTSVDFLQVARDAEVPSTVAVITEVIVTTVMLLFTSTETSLKHFSHEVP